MTLQKETKFISPSSLSFKLQIIAPYDLSWTLLLFKIWPSGFKEGFYPSTGKHGGPSTEDLDFFLPGLFPFLGAGSGITWQFSWRWNQMKIPSVSPVLSNWIRLKYVAASDVAMSTDRRSCYPGFLQNSLIRMRTSFVSEAKCQAFYWCVEENTSDLLDVGVSSWHALIWTLTMKACLYHQQHYCDLSLHKLSLCPCVECSHSALENFVARLYHWCAFLYPAGCPLSWTVSSLIGSRNAGTCICQTVAVISSYFCSKAGKTLNFALACWLALS